MGGKFPTRPRRGSGRLVSQGIGLLCCATMSLGFSSRSLAQAYGVYGPPPTITPGPVGTNVGAPAPPTAPGAAPAGGLQAQPPWWFTPSVEIGEAYNDNVNLASKGTPMVWDYITTITPGLNLVGNTARTNVNLTYDPQVLIFARSNNTDTVQQRLLATGRTEIVKETLFFDAQASIFQAYINATGPIGPTTLTTNANLQTINTASASPYVLQHLGPYADSETRYRFSYITETGNTVAPQQINEVLQRFTSGEYFDRLSWTVLGDLISVDRLSGTTDPLTGVTSKDQLYRADFKYPIYEALSAVAGGGYERISDPTLSPQPKGAIWNAGFAYQPNPYFSSQLTYGNRFQHRDIEFEATYKPSAETYLHAVYTKTFQTSQLLVASTLNQAVVGPNGTVINVQTGQPFVQNTVTPGTTSSVFGFTSGSFIETRAAVDLHLTRGRNSFSVLAYDTKISGQTVTSERIVGVTLDWQRQLWHDLSSDLSGTVYRTVFEDGSGRIDNSYLISAALTYNLSPTTTARGTLTRLDTRSNAPGIPLVNDIIMATIRKQF